MTSGTPSLVVPVLMYHKVGAEVAGRPDPFLNVTARAFVRQIALLSRLGYHGVTFREAAVGLARGSMPGKPVCITFDDGYACVADHAFACLRTMGWPATVFVPSGHIGGANEYDRPAGVPVQPLLTADALRDLAAAGWEVAGHTRSHPRLDELAPDEALAEIAGGRADLADLLGEEPATFCYPFGRLGAETPDLVRAAGFVAACTTRSGLATSEADPFLLPRVKVAGRDGATGLLYRLWLRPRLGRLKSDPAC